MGIVVTYLWKPVFTPIIDKQLQTDIRVVYMSIGGRRESKSPMMKILITSPFYPPDIGGISYHVENLATRLARRGWAVKVLTCTRKRPFRRRFGNMDVEAVRGIYPPTWPLQTMSSFSIPIGFSKRFLDSVHDFKPDLIHLHGHHYPITWLGAALAHACRLPALLTLHGMYALNPYSPYGKSFPEEIFNRTIFTTLLQICNAVIGLGKAAVEYAQKFILEPRPFYIIPNGIDVERYLGSLQRRFEFREKYGLPRQSKIVLFTGRFTYAKGVLELAESARYFHSEGAKVIFLLAGSGPLQRRLLDISERLENLIVLDWVPSDRIHELYVASDIFALPSKWEAQPVSVIEAMASHLQVVATPVGDVPSVLEGYPRKNFIKGFRSIDITEAVKQAISRLNEGSRPDPRVVEYVRNFDWNMVVSRNEAVYLRVVGQH